MVIALDVVRLTVNRLKGNIEAHLQVHLIQDPTNLPFQQVVSLVSKHFGNQKAVIKQVLMMTFMDLFQNVNPKMVIGTLAVSLENRNSRIREEVRPLSLKYVAHLGCEYSNLRADDHLSLED